MADSRFLASHANPQAILRREQPARSRLLREYRLIERYANTPNVPFTCLRQLKTGHLWPLQNRPLTQTTPRHNRYAARPHHYSNAVSASVELLQNHQNLYVRPTLTNTISFDGGDCCKKVPVMKPARFNAARKCSLMAQRSSMLG